MWGRCRRPLATRPRESTCALCKRCADAQNRETENAVIETLDSPLISEDAPDLGSFADPVPNSPIREKHRRDVLSTGARRSAVLADARHGAFADHAGRSAHSSVGGAEPALAGVSVIVPCFNEEGCIAETARQIQDALRQSGRPFEILFVDDGSTDATGNALAAIEDEKRIRVLRHSRNRGYGFSLKHGIEHAAHELIAIIDADGTYPIARLAELIDGMETADMVVGARVGKNVSVPLARRPAKWALRRLACYLAEYEIPDLNSGMRIMRRDVVRRFVGLLPDGFSFTTTITLAMLTHGYEVKYVPIDYARRIGRSSIRPVRDTMNFFSLIVRTVLCFKPLRVFAPASASLFATAVAVAAISKLAFGQLADVTSVTLAMSAVQLLGIGLVADLIDRRVPYAGG